MSRLHARQIADWVGDELYKKYVAGQEEHGGNVARKNVLGHLTEELLDALVYLAVLQEQMAMIRLIAESATQPTEALDAIISICAFGNEYKEREVEKEKEPQVTRFDEAYKKRISERVLEWLTK